MPLNKVVIVDTDAEVGKRSRENLSNKDIQITQYTSSSDALKAFKTEIPHVILCDLKMPDIDGLTLLRQFKKDFPAAIFIMTAEVGCIETAIKTLRAGAYHFLVKPYWAEFSSVIADAIEAVGNVKFNDLFEGLPTLEKIEERYIKLLLGKYRNQKDLVAKTLGINRRTLYRKERKFGIVND